MACHLSGSAWRGDRIRWGNVARLRILRRKRLSGQVVKMAVVKLFGYLPAQVQVRPNLIRVCRPLTAESGVVIRMAAVDDALNGIAQRERRGKNGIASGGEK